MDLRERVKRDLKILSLERKEKEKSEIIFLEQTFHSDILSQKNLKF
jgi:hypothetical protein